MLRSVFSGTCFGFFILMFGCTKSGQPVNPSSSVSLNGNLFVVTAYNWIPNADYTDWYTQLIDTAITTEVLHGGAVLIYNVGINGADTTYQQLPYSFGKDEYAVALSTNTAFIDIVETDLTGISNPGDYIFQVVVISPRMLHRKPYLNSSNKIPYQQLKQIIDEH